MAEFLPDEYVPDDRPPLNMRPPRPAAPEPAPAPEAAPLPVAGPVKRKPGRQKGWRPKPKIKIEPVLHVAPAPVQVEPPATIGRTAGITTYRLPEPEPEQPEAPHKPRFEEPELAPLELPSTSRTPDAARSSGQFSLRRLTITNHFTKQKRNVSVPMHKNPLDFIDRTCEVISEAWEAKFWSELQRDAELKAFKTMTDPLAQNASPHATRPPQYDTTQLLNTTE